MVLIESEKAVQKVGIALGMLARTHVRTAVMTKKTH
jgi:hypothetical protein